MEKKIRRSVLVGSLGALLVVLVAAAAAGATCAVPSPSYGTIQAAIDDSGCDPIALSPGVFEEDLVIGRDLTLRGAGAELSFVQGKVQVTAGTVSLIDLRIDTDASESQPPLSARSGAQLSARGVLAVRGAIVFRDGFETGGTDRWSAVMP